MADQIEVPVGNGVGTISSDSPAAISGQYTPVKSPVMLSSEQGADYVQKDQSTLNKLAGTPILANGGNTDVKYGADGNIDPNAGLPKTSTNASDKTASPGKIKYVNLDGQTTELNGDAITPGAVQALKDQGYFSSETSGNVPNWATTGDIATGMEQSKALKEVADAQTEFTNLKNQLSQFTVSDTDLRAQTDAIGKLWDSRVSDMNRINSQREASISTLGIRLGDRFTGGKGGAFGGIIAEEERQGVQRVAELEAKKLEAITAAKEAARTKNWEVYSKQVAFAEAAYKDKLDTIKELNKKVAENNQKIQDQAKASTRDVAIASLIKSGVVDSASIIAKLKEQGITATAKDVQDSIVALGPSGIKEIGSIGVDAAKNGAPSTIIDAISKATTVAEAIKAAGGYLQSTTGIVGEYLFYKRQAEASGQVPVDFDTYQTTDANRKASVNGQGDSRILSVTEAQALGVPFGTTAGQAYGKTPTKPPTDAQQKDSLYATRTTESGSIIANLEKTISGMNAAKFSASASLENTTLGNKFVSDEFRQERQAERNFVNSILRRESGAAISSTEFSNAEKQYFPRPGDDDTTLAQKAQNRATVIKGLIKAAGSAYEAPSDTGNDLLQSETQAESALKSYTTAHPEKTTEITGHIKTMEDSLGRPVTSQELLQAFPEYGENFNSAGNASASTTTSMIQIPETSKLAYVNNNPGNLRFAGQTGATQGKGGFAKFSSPEAGFKAIIGQLGIYARKGMTLAKAISTYAPPSENDTATYIKQIAEATGIPPNTPLSQVDHEVLAKAIAQKESSTKIS